MLSHLPREIEQTVTFRIDGPNDIAHRTNRLARDLGNRRERIPRIFIAVAKLLFGHFAENGDTGKVRADVVVQVGGDARAHVGNFQESRDAIAIKQKSRATDYQYDYYNEPPTRPHWRQDAKGDHCRVRAHLSIRIHRPHEEAVMPRCEPRVSDRALRGRRAPIAVCTLEHVLVAERFTR